MLARLARRCRRTERLGLRGQVGRRARARVLRARAAALRGALGQRHHEALSRAPRLNRALSSHSAILDGEVVAFDDAGRPSFGRLQRRMHVTAEAQVEAPVEGVAGRLRGLRPALARRPLASWAAVRASAASCWPGSTSTARTGRCPSRRRRRPRAAGGDARARPGGDRRQAARQPVRAGPAIGLLASRSRTRSARTSSSAAGCRARAAGASGSARCSSPSSGDDGRPALRRPRRHRLHGRASSTASGRCCAPLVRDDVAARGTGPKPPRGRRPRRAALRRRGRVHRVDERRRPARAVLQGLREDVPARPPRADPRTRRRPVRGGRRSTVEDRVLKVTNLDKVLYPEAGFTKRDVIEYYVAHRARPAAAPAATGR